MTELKETNGFSQPGRQFLLWTGLLLPPLVWGAQLELVYLLSDYGCLKGSFLPIHLVSVAALALTIIGGLLSWHHWMKAGGEWKSETAGSLPRSRFIAILGVLLAAVSALLVIGTWMPALTGVPCVK